MAMPSLTQVGVFALALALGVAFAFCLITQLKLQRQAMAGQATASLFTRLTMAGLSMAVLFGTVLISKAFPDITGYENFMLTASFGAIATFLVRLRSNSTVKRDARKSSARPLP